MTRHYVISGHSGQADKTFTIPYNISIVFYAEKDTQCYVPNDEDSLQMVVNTMKHSHAYKLHQSGDTIDNYQIDFSKDYEGIALIKDIDQNDLQFEFVNDANSGKTLKDYCVFVQKKSNRLPAVIYCVFCRGSKKEDDADYGDFDNLPMDVKQHILADFEDPSAKGMLFDQSETEFLADTFFDTPKTSPKRTPKRTPKKSPPKKSLSKKRKAESSPEKRTNKKRRVAKKTPPKRTRREPTR